jgi:glycosyltransferase involved in cell wall biosynthesis
LRIHPLTQTPEVVLIAAIVPAHNEEALVGDCVRSLVTAARCPALLGETVVVLVVLDACTDQTEAAAQRAGAETISLNARNVGATRAFGAQWAIKRQARWLAFTDADTVVTPSWISAQLSQRSDAVCGTVAVSDWGSYGERMRRHYDATYTDADGHSHIHGANLGVSSQAYLAAGGFPSVTSSEDVALVSALQRIGASVAWSAAPRVFTSARRAFRAPLGFGATLLQVEFDSQALAASAGG